MLYTAHSVTISMNKKNKRPLVNNRVQLVTIFLGIYLAFFLISCHSKNTHGKKIVISEAPGTHEFAAHLSDILGVVDTPGKKQLNDIPFNMYYGYQLHEYAPLWLKDGKPNEAASKLLTELRDVYYDGLDTAKYHIGALEKLLAASGNLKSTEKQIEFDTTFTIAYLQAAHDLVFGAVASRKVDSLWFHANDSVWIAPDIMAKKDDKFPSLDVYRSKLPTYAMMRNEFRHYAALSSDSTFTQAIAQVASITNYTSLDSAQHAAVDKVVKTELPWLQSLVDSNAENIKQALSNYQYYMDIKVSGKLDSFTVARLSRTPAQMQDELKTNMERVRWMPQEVGDLYLVIDIPAMELFFRKDGMDVMHMRTVVGKLERQTPSLGANMANVVINPPWGVPPTILKKDVLPGITKSGKKYLDKKGLKVYDRKGKTVDATRVNTKNYKNYVYKQDPGDDNSLGYVKFNLPNPWDIYLHDTPHRDDFVKRNRFLSSGCVRLEQPQEMALYILGDLEKKRYTQDRLDSVIRTHKTRWEILKNKIPVHIVYLTNFEDTNGRHLRYLRDIYGRNDKLIAAMK